MGRIGVTFDDSPSYYAPHNEHHWITSNGQQQLSVITQNVDALHHKAGTVHVAELHGRTRQLQCMSCGETTCRTSFHTELERLNAEWLQQALQQKQSNDLRPDGDAHVAVANYEDVIVPPCTNCGDGFLKPDVVFFGDVVPKHRVERCKAAVQAADGLLCIGTSLAVHSAFRFIRLARSEGIPIAILNVGETRAETEGVDLLKIEAPIGATLTACVEHFSREDDEVESKANAAVS
jgi:NAD-dependent deacetylase sirtuin 4